MTLYMPFTPGLDRERLDWSLSPSSLTSGRELMEGAELRAVAERGLLFYSAVGHSEQGCQFDTVALATQTSPLTSTGHFSNVCGWS